MIIFDGKKSAQLKEDELREKISLEIPNKKLVIAAVLFSQDVGSKLYTRLKGEAAARIGIEYRVFEFSLDDSLETIKAKIIELGSDKDITGIIIQKPWRKTWLKFQSEEFINSIENQADSKTFLRQQYKNWWEELTSCIAENKDVDGLHPNTIKKISSVSLTNSSSVNLNRILPATCQAVINIFNQAFVELSKNKKSQEVQKIFNGKYIIIGKSDLLGIPLFYELKRQGKDVEILASKELNKRMNSGQKLLDATVIISATGTKGLVTGDMISDNVIIIDVGEPKADIDFDSVSEKSAFITPVPGGVGPMTVVSLLENCVKLAM